MPNNTLGLAGVPSNRMQQAMSGAPYGGEPQLQRCEDIIARKLGCYNCSSSGNQAKEIEVRLLATAANVRDGRE